MTPVALKRRNKRDGGPAVRRPGGRRLSPWRVALGLGVVVVVAAAVVVAPRAVEWSRAALTPTATTQWYAGYFDATAGDGTEIAEPTGDDSYNVVLSFIVAAAADRCEPTWGTHYTFDEAAASVDLDRRIARMRTEGANISVSFGGALNTDLAVACTDVDALAAAYTSVVDRYGIAMIDLDVERDNLSDSEAAKRRAHAIAQVQAERDALDVWLTLPVTTQGLTEDGLQSVREMWDAGVALAGVNIMTMDYNEDLGGATMAEAAIGSLTAAHDQLADLADEAGVSIDPWRMLGVTPMIGQNDVADEVFGLDDAVALNAFAAEKGIARISMWSLNRDRECGPNHPAAVVVSDRCSGVDQEAGQFATLLSAGFEDRPTPMSSVRPSPATVAVDDPATSPYPVWNEDAEYSAGVKVVWKGNVYVANWWIQGLPEPNDPTLAAGESAWSLIGPVLDGEPAYALPTVPAGTYPDWSADTVYLAGDRVVWNGTPFEAKWWTQGESPADAITAPSRSPWSMLDGTG